MYKKLTLLCPDWGFPEDLIMDHSANSTIFSHHSDWKTESRMIISMGIEKLAINSTLIRDIKEACNLNSFS